MRVMAIDYGDARTGVAVSDAMGIICGEAFTINEWNFERLCDTLADTAKQKGAEVLVLGLPKNMDGTEGDRAAISRNLASILEEKTGLKVILWDERRSSIEAHAILHANGRKMKDHRKNVDAVAAQLMLEGYLGRL